jgi:2',3'-cyclic-nucleotide 2'-phosphodiesterase
MKFLIFWDIYGKVGRKMLAKHLPDLRVKYSPDVVIANNENISHGKGPRMNQIQWCEEQGVDIMTGWNHTLESMNDIAAFLDIPDSKQLRPDNIMGENISGTGHREFIFGDKKILVINLIGTIFMGDIMANWEKYPTSNPYQKIDHILKDVDVSEYEAILVDFHKETTSEGYAMANHLDGRVSLLWGTHTHVQTADADIWPGGMGFLNDLGFAGARRSIIGVEWEAVKHRFIDDLQKWLMPPDDEGPGLLSGMYAEIIDRKCVKIEPFRICE